MELTLNRYFKHKFRTDNVITSFMRKDEGTQMYNLYIRLVNGKEIKGMSGSTEFMLSTGLRQDDWGKKLDEWTKDNQYIDYSPNKVHQSEAASMVIKVRKAMDEHGLRLGQGLINELGEKTPTPNPNIFNSNDENEVLVWFYDKHVIQSGFIY
jgi:hypothetical protein